MIQPNDAQNTFNALVGFDILLGLILCFFGYLLSRIRIVFGLILGCAWGANIGYAISQNPWWAIIAGIVGGLLGAALSAAFYLVGLFLIGAILGGSLGSIASSAITHQDPNPLVIFISAILAGGIVLLFKQLRIFITIVATALGGAGFVIFGILSFFFVKAVVFMSWPDTFAQHGNFFGYAVFFGWVVLAAAGIAAQYKLMPPDAEKLRIEKQMDSAGTGWDGDTSKL